MTFFKYRVCKGGIYHNKQISVQDCKESVSKAFNVSKLHSSRLWLYAGKGVKKGLCFSQENTGFHVKATQFFFSL